MDIKHCEQCGVILGETKVILSARFCWNCAEARNKQCRKRYAVKHRRQYQNAAKARGEVANAVAHGKLPRLDGSIACVDCGKPAQNYDHRDYAKPLEVVPVCIPCNIERGPGINRISDFEHILLRVWMGPMTFVDKPPPEGKPPQCAMCRVDISNRTKGSRFCFPCTLIRNAISAKASRQPDPLLYIFHRVLAGPIATA